MRKPGRTLVDDDERAEERRAAACTPRRAEEHACRAAHELVAAEEHHRDEVQRAVDGQHPPEHLPEVQYLHGEARVDVGVHRRARHDGVAVGAEPFGEACFCDTVCEDGVVPRGNALLFGVLSKAARKAVGDETHLVT